MLIPHISDLCPHTFNTTKLKQLADSKDVSPLPDLIFSQIGKPVRHADTTLSSRNSTALSLHLVIYFLVSLAESFAAAAISANQAVWVT
ncbi:hypothetical protein BDN70DRAFT_939907 [Pholiota conissans]|uniref:Uncharacterized protein n=1 Tax=Pholiota conissans TaxID=109636 RepID=A0A9P6CKP7_9AGAR|nr:hypothetical protein BDN70DRAFT_939907 [Pholiota conissans]